MKPPFSLHFYYITEHVFCQSFLKIFLCIFLELNGNGGSFPISGKSPPLPVNSRCGIKKKPQKWG